jgi:lipopolysaccharide/colanic/teichoic acid biosynthesis glycosyltransferase
MSLQRWNNFFEQALIDTESVEHRRLAAKCLVACRSTQSLKILARVAETGDEFLCSTIANVLADSTIEDAEELLWSLLRKRRCINACIDSLVARGPTVVRGCKHILEDGSAPDEAKSAAVQILCSVGGASVVSYLQAIRRGLSADVNYHVTVTLQKEFFPDNAEAVELLGTRMEALYPRLIKPAVDRVVGAILLIPCLPIMAGSAILVHLTSPGPVFYHQTRVGLRGKLFTVLKFRTMLLDAESDGRPQWASVRDPRVTMVGNFLRTTRLDELPQLFNVLRGEMSLVGPRPERPFFHAELRAEIPLYDGRVLAKPGITGLAQIEYAYYISREDAQRSLVYDLQYVALCSFWFDLKILIRTVSKTLLRQYAR